MLKTLQRLKDDHLVCEICDDRDTSCSYQGYITSFDEKYVLYAIIKIVGFEDGYGLSRINEIRHIKYATKECLRNERLYHLRNEHHKKLNLQQGIPLLHQILKLSKDEHKILCIYISDIDESPLTGYVKDFDHDLVTLQLFNKYGQNNGGAIIETQKIYEIEIDTVYNNSIEMLINKSL